MQSKNGDSKYRYFGVNAIKLRADTYAPTKSRIFRGCRGIRGLSFSSKNSILGSSFFGKKT
jgi:hypothetical protein